jgi:hypothetical protein
MTKEKGLGTLHLTIIDPHLGLSPHVALCYATVREGEFTRKAGESTGERRGPLPRQIMHHAVGIVEPRQRYDVQLNKRLSRKMSASAMVTR